MLTADETFFRYFGNVEIANIRNITTWDIYMLYTVYSMYIVELYTNTDCIKGRLTSDVQVGAIQTRTQEALLSSRLEEIIS